MLEVLQIIGGILLTLFLPGFTLVRALFPAKGELDKEYNLLYQVTLGIGMSIVLTILDGFALNILGVNPETGLGYVTTVPLALSLSSLTILFFLIGWYRGAYPILGKIHPKFYREAKKLPTEMEPPLPEDKTVLEKLEHYAKRRQALRNKIKDCERKSKVSERSMQKYYERKKEDLEKELQEVNTKIAELEKKKARELY